MNAQQSHFDTHLYLTTALTNLHVGSGKNNYGIIDHLVQRDVTTNFPTINASSLKGALREYLSKGVQKDLSTAVNYAFGADTRENGITESSQGAYRFFAAQLLSMPVRSNVRPFFRATCPQLIQDLLDYLNAFSLSLPAQNALINLMETLQEEEAVYFDAEAFLENPIIEDFDIRAKHVEFQQLASIENILGENIVLLSDQKFSALTDNNHLPVIARNSLENGVSVNLWYEQIVPRQARFCFLLLAPHKDKYQKDISEALVQGPIQIGGNASIGYGFCKLQAHALTPLKASVV